MKSKFLLGAVLALSLSISGCFFDSDSNDTPKSSTSSSSVSSSSVKTSTKLVVNTKDPMKRIVVDAPSNKILNVTTKQDVTYGEYDEVIIEWGEVSKQTYSFEYFFTSTGNPVRLDSVVYSDSLTYSTANTSIDGMLISDQIGLTGDGKIAVNYINGNDSVKIGNKVVKYNRMHDRPYDSLVTMTVYGRDTVTNNPEKLIIKFKVKQTNFVSVTETDSSYKVINFTNDTIKFISWNYTLNSSYDSIYRLAPKDSLYFIERGKVRPYTNGGYMKYYSNQYTDTNNVFGYIDTTTNTTYQLGLLPWGEDMTLYLTYLIPQQNTQDFDWYGTTRYSYDVIYKNGAMNETHLFYNLITR